MSRYFQITTDNKTKLPESITEISSSAARSRADKGPHWFTLRTGRDEAAPVGFHATYLNSNQQAQLEAYRLATPGCALPADWSEDYPNDEAEQARRIYGGGHDVRLSSKPLPTHDASWGAGEYIKALPK